MPRSTHLLAAVALTAALAVPLLPTGSTAYAGPPTCDGLSATIVGSGPGLLNGTPDDDVIVTAGATTVRAGAGDDHVCVTVPTPTPLVSVVAAGGDDVVSVTGVGADVVEVTLGIGDDVFRGGPEADRVGDHVLPGIGAGGLPPSGRDVITTGAGDDDVSVGQPDLGSGDPGEAVSDQVALGTGDDTLSVASQIAPGFAAVGGAGRDYFVGWTETASQRGAVWRLDAARGRIDRGADSWVWSSFERVQVGMDPVRFHGGPADEYLFSWFVPELAELGAGDDTVELVGSVDPGASLLAGPGRDLLRVWELSQYPVTVDLGAGEIRSDSARFAPIPMRGFEALDLVSGARLTMIGTDGPDVLRGVACRVRASGLGGDDVLAATDPGDAMDCRIRARLYGGAGDDRLSGSAGRNEYGGYTYPGPDRLIGGPGRDRANGRGGRDLCRAEVRRHCERR